MLKPLWMSSALASEVFGGPQKCLKMAGRLADSGSLACDLFLPGCARGVRRARGDVTDYYLKKDFDDKAAIVPCTAMALMGIIEGIKAFCGHGIRCYVPETRRRYLVHSLMIYSPALGSLLPHHRLMEHQPGLHSISTCVIPSLKKRRGRSKKERKKQEEIIIEIREKDKRKLI